MKYAYFVFFTATIMASLTLSGCVAGGENAHQLQHQSINASKPTAEAHLPINAGQWTTWHCSDGNTIRTRYTDKSAHELSIETNTGQYLLVREASLNPIIYSNASLSFFSDGQYAAIGKSLSDEVISGGCTVL